MKLTLEEIWKMADLLEEAQKIKLGSKKLVQEKPTNPASKAGERVLKLPKLQISENWGKADKVERQELERIVDTATRGKKNAFDKLRIIQEQMTKLTSGKLGKIRNPRRILSQIILLETMNRLFKSFQPAPAGFINEAFLSVFYGGMQTAAGEANVAKDIGDVTDPEGIPISIKTKGSGALIVDGSVENLYSSINRAGKVYFDIYEKITEGGDANSHVGTLKVVRFVVDANNINQFLGKEAFTIGKDGKLVPKMQFKRGGKDVVEEALQMSVEDIVAVISDFPIPVEDSKLKQWTSSLGPRQFNELISKLEIAAQQSKDAKQKEVFKKAIMSLSSIEISKRKLDKTTTGLEREFSRTETQWKNFARQSGVDAIVLKFSDKEINGMLQSAVEELDAGIVQIFNTLDGFSQSINTYLTSISSNRGQDGLKALEYAKRLEPETKQVVQKTTGETQE
jgi:hypothetical protein